MPTSQFCKILWVRTLLLANVIETKIECTEDTMRKPSKQIKETRETLQVTSLC